jgi:hypothetical protein
MAVYAPLTLAGLANRRVTREMGFTVTGGRVVAIDALTDTDRLNHLELAALDE